MGSHTPSYDFIIVGAGASGAAFAWRLAYSTARPSVLLIEAGPKHDRSLRVDGDRYGSMMQPSQGWMYKTVPQKHLDDRELEFARGKGLGGSTAINFACWSVGPSDDWDEIARLTGDDEWKWESTNERLRRLVAYDGLSKGSAEGLDRYVAPTRGLHANKGPLKLGHPKSWEPDTFDMFDYITAAGYQINGDMNSGNPLGVAAKPSSCFGGVRTTSADLLVDAPSNLTTITTAQIAKVTFSGKHATGVQTVDGRKFICNKEVILSAGVVDSPRILLHSGIGASAQLAKFSIPTIADLPAVGQNYRDHLVSFISWIRKPEHASNRLAYFRDTLNLEVQRKNWSLDPLTSTMSTIGCQLGLLWAKNDATLSSTEFAALPSDVKRLATKHNVPTFEVGLNFPYPLYYIAPDAVPGGGIECLAVILMNMQSRGSVTLQSADPAIPLAIDPNFFAHPYDKRIAVEATREMLAVARTEKFAEKMAGPMSAPESESEEDIHKFWRQNGGTTWHGCGTCKMIVEGEEERDAVVDRDFRVFGVEGLRVVDMSVVPILPNNHTQSTAYVAGLIAGDKLMEEYGLEIAQKA